MFSGDIVLPVCSGVSTCAGWYTGINVPAVSLSQNDTAILNRINKNRRHVQGCSGLFATCSWRVQGCSGLFATVRGVRTYHKANTINFRGLRYSDPVSRVVSDVCVNSFESQLPEFEKIQMT
jgi:hypothetical protein